MAVIYAEKPVISGKYAFKSTPLVLPIKILVFAVLIFMCCRTALWGSYPEYFGNLSGLSILYAYVLGIRFDLAVTTQALSPLLLLLLLPFRWFQHKNVRLGLSWLAFSFLMFLALVYLCDIVYFGEVKRHVGGEALLLGQDYQLLFDLALDARWPLTVLALLLILLSAFVWYLWIIRPIAAQPVLLPAAASHKLLFFSVCMVLFVWFGRGLVVVSKPIDTSDAFSDARLETANLALNGAFALFRDITRNKHNALKLLSEEALAIESPKYLAQNNVPFEWRDLQNVPNQRNIVFILLESWSYKYIDALAGRGYGVTPFIDSLIEKSQVWTRFYAAGQRSIYGIQAILTSIPILPGQDELGYGLELHNMSRLGLIFQDAGYQTLMVQSSNRRSFHLDGIASSLGFEHYFGQEDIPVIRSYPEDTPRFGWDYDTMMFMHNRLDALSENSQPFLGFVFTGTTHEPFANPGKEFAVYPHDPSSESGFLNTLYYSDWALAQFFARARQSEWFKNTTFVITADHVLRADSEKLEAQFHIPLLVYTPDGSMPAAQHDEIASQYDLMPTLVDLAGLNVPVYSFGGSLLDGVQPDFNYVKIHKGSLIGLVSPVGTALFTDKADIAEISPESPLMRSQISHLQWRLQLSYERLRKNRWAPVL
jgi:phosphoglycerol transferase MdoB-like AlkP superfamily enzyme